MPSPFPGMDPYLERNWRDVHQKLVTYAADALNGVLPGDLIARSEERVVVDSVHYDRPRAIYPDVRVYQDPAGEAAGPGAVTRAATGTVAGAGDAAAVAEPIVLEFESEQHAEPYVTIIDPEGGELVTAIEFLSPANKLPGEEREQYRRKRAELRQAAVNLVEVDLLRQGQWRELLLPVVAPARVQTAYRAITWRARPRSRVELYPIGLRGRLPIIPVPLRPTDPDVALDLQALLDQIYRNGRYDRTDYRRPPDPPLDAEHAAWADELLRAAGRR